MIRFRVSLQLLWEQRPYGVKVGVRWASKEATVQEGQAQSGQRAQRCEVGRLGRKDVPWKLS